MPISIGKPNRGGAVKIMQIKQLKCPRETKTEHNTRFKAVKPVAPSGGSKNSVGGSINDSTTLQGGIIKIRFLAEHKVTDEMTRGKSKADDVLFFVRRH